MKTIAYESYWPFLNYELPRLDRLGENLYGASFFLMKLLPARVILQTAEAEGKLKRGSRIIETTSGTFGLALAMLSAVKGYRLTLVSDPVIDERLYRRLRDLGTEVEIVDSYLPEGGYQKARLDRLHALLTQNPQAFWPNQYANENNPKSYAKVGSFLVNELENIDFLVGPVGSGGSMVGTSTYLRGYNPQLKVVGVDTCKSVLFGQKNGDRVLRGLGNSIMPEVLDHSVFDWVSWIPGSMAFQATRHLHQTHGLFMGGTSGAAYFVASWLAKKHPEAKIVVFFPDEGHRYVDTIYNDNWLEHIADANAPMPADPLAIEHPGDNEEAWTIMNWNRRSLDDVLTRR